MPHARLDRRNRSADHRGGPRRQRISRRSGYRFADKDMRHSRIWSMPRFNLNGGCS